MTMLDNIQSSVRIYMMLKERIASAHDFLPEDQCLIDALDGLDTLDGLTDLHEQIAALVRDAVRTSAMADSRKIIIADNQTRRQRFEARAERLRSLALCAMNEAGIKKIEAPVSS